LRNEIANYHITVRDAFGSDTAQTVIYYRRFVRKTLSTFSVREQKFYSLKMRASEFFSMFLDLCETTLYNVSGVAQSV